MENTTKSYEQNYHYNINPVSKKYFFLTCTERALIERSLMDWYLQNYLQKMWVPVTTLQDVVDNVFLVESMSDVELIENLANMETMRYGGEWQSESPKEGSMILAVRPEIYDLFKQGRVKNTQMFFEEQNWNYEGQLVKKMNH